MAGKEIRRKDLFKRLSSVKKQSQWLKAAETLGFRITSGGKHPYVVRDPENPNNGDFKCSVTTIPSNLHAIINQRIFKQILNSPISERMGIAEDEIWNALGF